MPTEPRIDRIKSAVIEEGIADDRAQRRRSMAEFDLRKEMERIAGYEPDGTIEDIVQRQKWQELLDGDSDDNKLPELYEAYRKAKADADKAWRTYEMALERAYEEVR